MKYDKSVSSTPSERSSYPILLPLPPPSTIGSIFSNRNKFVEVRGPEALEDRPARLFNLPLFTESEPLDGLNAHF